MSGADPVSVAIRVAGILEQLGVRYILGGSMASVAHGEPRATLDVDLAADLLYDQVDRFLAAVESDFLVDGQWVADGVKRRGSFQLVHRKSMIRVDFFVPEWTGFHFWKWERRCRINLGGEESASVDVTGPDGIVVQKLIWFRAGGEVSDRQWRDVLGVLKNQRGKLSWEEMQSYAASSGVADLLAQACDEAGVLP